MFHRRGPGRHARPGSLRPFGADVAVAVAVLAAIGFHLAVMVSAGSPSGVDFGNWLYFGHQILGDPVMHAPTTYPPLVPVLAVATTAAFGPLWADAILMSVAGAAPAVGVYLACRLCGIRWAAVPATILLAFTGSTGEAIAWGGAPQLIGLGAAATALALGTRLLAHRSLRAAAAFSATVFLIAITSHLVFAQFVLTALILVGLVAITNRPNLSGDSWKGRNGWLMCFAIIVAPLLVLIPLYRQLLTIAGGAVGTTTTTRGWPSVRMFLENLWAVYREAPVLWKLLLTLAVLSPLLTIGARRRNNIWALTTATVLAVLVQAVISAQDRLVYFAPLGVAFAATATLSEAWATRAMGGTVRRRLSMFAAAGLTFALLYPVAPAIRLFHGQRDFYGAFVPKGTIEGLDWIRDHSGGGNVMLAAPINGAPFGWWVQGYARRPTIVASRDKWLNFPFERSRAQAAVAILSTPDPLDAATLHAARQRGAAYLVIPWAWGGLRRAQLTRFEDHFPGHVRFNNAALVVIEVPH